LTDPHAGTYEYPLVPNPEERPMGTCPDCEENIEIDDEAEIGDAAECPKCHVRLEILSTFPVAFDYASEVEE
jgi:uncharacterized paraquat-inducible protein A